MSPSLLSVLELLADGHFHSGAAIGERLNVSRSAVWKHLQTLSGLGLSVESVKGKGYRLPGGLQLLNEQRIRENLSPEVLSSLAAIDVHMQADSTNSLATSYPMDDRGLAYACLAEYQHAGRGRRGRQWISPFGHNIYLSLAWQFDQGASQLEGLSLAVGVVIAKVLSTMGVKSIALKWPNDILINDRKLGGILLEMSGDPAGVCRVVIGIGLNVRMPEDVDVGQPWASIAEQLPGVSRNQLVAELLNGLVGMLSTFPVSGFSPYKDEWQQYDAYQGQQVVVSSGQTRFQGLMLGVHDNGALRLHVDGQEQAIYGGEVSLRSANEA